MRMVDEPHSIRHVLDFRINSRSEESFHIAFECEDARVFDTDGVQCVYLTDLAPDVLHGLRTWQHASSESTLRGPEERRKPVPDVLLAQRVVRPVTVRVAQQAAGDRNDEARGVTVINHEYFARFADDLRLNDGGPASSHCAG